MVHLIPNSITSRPNLRMYVESACELLVSVDANKSHDLTQLANLSIIAYSRFSDRYPASRQDALEWMVSECVEFQREIANEYIHNAAMELGDVISMLYLSWLRMPAPIDVKNPYFMIGLLSVTKWEFDDEDVAVELCDLLAEYNRTRNLPSEWYFNAALICAHAANRLFNLMRERACAPLTMYDFVHFVLTQCVTKYTQPHKKDTPLLTKADFKALDLEW